MTYETALSLLPKIEAAEQLTMMIEAREWTVSRLDRRRSLSAAAKVAVAQQIATEITALKMARDALLAE